MKKHTSPALASTLLSAVLLLSLSACGPAPRQMPVASPTVSATPQQTKAPSDELPKNAATKESPVLLATRDIGSGVTVKAYRVGTGTVVAQQLAANPALKSAGVKEGAKLAVVRYTLTNTGTSAVATASFAYNGVFIAGGGQPAATDNGYASAAARLGYASTPVAQFTDKKGDAGNWSLAPGKSANWYTDWVLEGEGVLAQNYFLSKKITSNVRVNLLKQ